MTDFEVAFSLMEAGDRIAKDPQGWCAYHLAILGELEEIPHFPTPLEAIQWLRANEKIKPFKDPVPIGTCPKCGTSWYSNEGFCGVCKP